MNKQINQILVLETLRERLKYHIACGNEDLVKFMKQRIKKIQGEIEVPGYPGFSPKKMIS